MGTSTAIRQTVRHRSLFTDNTLPSGSSFKRGRTSKHDEKNDVRGKMWETSDTDTGILDTRGEPT